jgi:hypothetical protein
MTQPENSFAERLQSQLLLRGKPISPTSLARDFNLRWQGAPISTNAARKWLYGPTLPKMEKIQVLAKMLGTSAEWLRWGESSDTKENETGYLNKQLAEAVLHDWYLLNNTNKQLISALLNLMLKQQKSQK